MSRLNDGAATKTAESKVQFMEQLTAVVSEILAAKRSGEDVSPHEWDTTKNMVLQVSCMKSHFHPEDINRAAGWLMDIEGFDGRRSRSARASIVSEYRGSNGSQRSERKNNNDDNSDDDDEDEDDDYAFDERTGNGSDVRAEEGSDASAAKVGAAEIERGACLSLTTLTFVVYAKTEESSLFVMDSCLRTFHPQCLGLDSAPAGDTWECSDCREKNICA